MPINVVSCNQFSLTVSELEEKIVDVSKQPGPKGEDGDKVRITSTALIPTQSSIVPSKYIGAEDVRLNAPVRFVDIRVIRSDGSEDVVTVPDYRGYTPPEGNYSEYVYDTSVNRAVNFVGSDISINGEKLGERKLDLIPEKYTGLVRIRVYDEVVSVWYKGLVAVDKYAEQTVNELIYISSDSFAINAQLPPKVTELVQTFAHSTAESYPGIENWNTSNVTDMSFTFSYAYSFNQDISRWNTENVLDMQEMFHAAYAFNQDISVWNTSKVKNMAFMFGQAYVFNQPIGAWDVSHVEDMGYMFQEAREFNQNLNTWNTRSLTEMTGIFEDAAKFNKPLNSWNTAQVVGMEMAFAGATAFNQPLGNWNTVNVQAMGAMFMKAKSFNQDISGWNVANVINHLDFDTETSASWTSDKKPLFK